MKSTGRKIAKRKRRTAPARARRSSAAGEKAEIARLRHELDDALEQQAATSEALRVISSSPGELEPVFQSMLENATRICEANFGALFRFDGNKLYPAASVGTPPAL